MTPEPPWSVDGEWYVCPCGYHLTPADECLNGHVAPTVAVSSCDACNGLIPARYQSPNDDRANGLRFCPACTDCR